MSGWGGRMRDTDPGASQRGRRNVITCPVAVIIVTECNCGWFEQSLKGFEGSIPPPPRSRASRLWDWFVDLMPG